jgi:dolichyl-phosphate beta-glucosyltransferase
MQTCTIIIPCFNEEDRLNLGLMDEFLLARQHYSLVLVNDGSSDHTSRLLHEFQKRHPEKVATLDLESNLGKGNAIRQGVLFALDQLKPDNVGYMDADFSTPFSEIEKLFTCLDQHKNFTVVFGSRVKRMGCRIKRSAIRHYPGRIFATFVSLLLKLPVYDSQCGAKAMKVAIAKELFKDEFITSWLFDVELLFRYMKIYGEERTLSEVYEFPLFEWKETRGSKIRFFHLPVIPFELIRIYIYYSH